jgi:Farnesoic acid 0-methyl transferase
MFRLPLIKLSAVCQLDVIIIVGAFITRKLIQNRKCPSNTKLVVNNECCYVVCHAVSSIQVSTLPIHNYNQLSKTIFEQTSIVVRVQSCRDAHVALSEMFNNIQTRTYEVIIGGNGNQNSFIRDLDTSAEFQRVDTPGIMDCNNYKAFWVSWADNRIKVGRGADVGESSFLDWTDPERRFFRGVTISTWDGAAGWWDFSYLEGRCWGFKGYPTHPTSRQNVTNLILDGGLSPASKRPFLPSWIKFAWGM